MRGPPGRHTYEKSTMRGPRERLPAAVLGEGPGVAAVGTAGSTTGTAAGAAAAPNQDPVGPRVLFFDRRDAPEVRA